MTWFSSKSKIKIKNKQVEEISILKYKDMPSIALLRKLFSYENALTATPIELTKEILKRINSGYSPQLDSNGLVATNGLVAMGGEGAVFHAINDIGKDICVKIVRPELNITEEERPENFKKDDWQNYQDALQRFKERFYKGIQNQKFLVSEAREISYFNFPIVRLNSIDLEIRKIELKERIKRLNDLHDRTTLPSKRMDIKGKIEEIKSEIENIRIPFIYLEMEWIDGPLILSHLKTKKDVIFSLGKYCDLLDAIQFMHSRKIIHRDLKSPNVMISGKTEKESKLYVVDLTFSKREGDTQNLTAIGEGIGTAPYASPQQLALGNAISSGIRDDICSLGFMLVEFFHCVYLPTTKKEDLQNFQKRQAYIRSCAACLPEQLRKIFIKATEFEPEKRYGSVELLKSEIVKSIDDIKNNGFECLEMRDPTLYINSMLENEITFEDSELTIIDRDLNYDLCSNCEKKEICSLFDCKLCNQIILAEQELKKEGYL